MNPELDLNRIELEDDHIIYLNILHFTMSFSIIAFLIVISVLFLGMSAKSPFAKHEILSFFTVINIMLNGIGQYLFNKAPKRIARSYTNHGKFDQEFYQNITGIIVSMIISRNITIVFPSIMACVALFISVSGGEEFIYSWYSLNAFFPFFNLFVLFRNRPSRRYITETMLAWF